VSEEGEGVGQELQGSLLEGKRSSIAHKNSSTEHKNISISSLLRVLPLHWNTSGKLWKGSAQEFAAGDFAAANSHFAAANSPAAGTCAKVQEPVRMPAIVLQSARPTNSAGRVQSLAAASAPTNSPAAVLPAHKQQQQASAITSFIHELAAPCTSRGEDAVDQAEAGRQASGGREPGGGRATAASCDDRVEQGDSVGAKGAREGFVCGEQLDDEYRLAVDRGDGQQAIRWVSRLTCSKATLKIVSVTDVLCARLQHPTLYAAQGQPLWQLVHPEDCKSLFHFARQQPVPAELLKSSLRIDGNLRRAAAALLPREQAAVSRGAGLCGREDKAKIGEGEPKMEAGEPNMEAGQRHVAFKDEDGVSVTVESRGVAGGEGAASGGGAAASMGQGELGLEVRMLMLLSCALDL